MASVMISAWCNHCDKGYQTPTGNEGLCPTCFVNGHRGRTCDEYCKPAEPKRYPDMTEIFKSMEVRAEWQRLRSAVVEAAKAWDQATFYTVRDVEKRVEELSDAVDALNAFEASHAVGQKDG